MGVAFRYLFCTCWALFLWAIIAIMGRLMIEQVIPSADAPTSILGIPLDWRYLPGGLLGIFVALHSLQTHIHVPVRSQSSTPDPRHHTGLWIFVLLWSLPSGLSLFALSGLAARNASWVAYGGALLFPAIHVF